MEHYAELKKLKSESIQALSEIYSEREAVNIVKVLEEDLLPPGISVLTDAQCLRWNDALQRLLNHEPLAYITGISWFLHLKLQVSPAVLIPRPETEELASLVMKELKHRPDAKILDIGTGSGCIALAIKSTLPTVHMHAVDISQDALDLAGKNAEALKTDISFHCLDICDTMQWKLLPSDLDVIVSNPPYIPLNEKPLMSMSTVLHEPHLALFTGEDALVFYRVIALFGKKHLKAGGIIWVEINEFAGEDTLNIFKEHGYSQVQIAQDINGKDRFISCKNT